MAPDHPLVAGHKGPVLDIAWCKHNDNVIGELLEILQNVTGQRQSKLRQIPRDLLFAVM